MVKRVLKFLAYTLFFIFALMVFIPKSSVYYLLEEKIKNFDVVISKETLKENIFSLGVKNLNLSFKDIEVGVVDEADIELLLFYNRLHFKKIQLSSLVKAYLPSKVEELQITYTIFNPLVLKVEGRGEFGEIDAAFDILKRSLRVQLHPTNMMLKRYKKSMRMFKKSKDGVYIYAKSF
ncbi:hypothetical protein JHD47_07975 [Sulfurimonas sp. SAG-AH-194-L11]|nr:hypothetical protein [Sulfurimonas sp. SAG-AH-194-L11]MDF1877752.1 hypothetical protein [Sulfurimonas sp. SAG-AH-194-L11]